MKKNKIPSCALIRSGSSIYEKVKIGKNFICGHNVLIREGCKIGNNVSIGTNTILDGYIKIKNNVDIQSACYLPPKIIIDEFVFIGPNVVFTNDPKPLKKRKEYKALTTKLKRNVTIGAGSIILPGITINENSFIAAGSIVTKNLPKNSLYIKNKIIKNVDWILEKNSKKRWSK
jgi:acetyltransferase-like isoleucine patch superfamily enzyme